LALVKSRASWNDLVYAPTAGSVRGPVCMLCGRLVDSEELVEGYAVDLVRGIPGSPTAKVLVRHHGAEELRTFDMGSTNWDEQDLASMMRRTNWFDPTSYEGLGLGHKNPNAGDHDGGDTDDVQVTPMIVVPK
jgi:hypothetical protein